MAKAKVTVRVPRELQELMVRYPEVNWSAVFRDAGDDALLAGAADAELAGIVDVDAFIEQDFENGAAFRDEEFLARARKLDREPALLGLGAVDLLEHVGRQAADAMKFFHGLKLWPCVTGAADLKFLHHLQQARLGTSNRKAALES